MFARSEHLKKLRSDYHAFRQEARETAFSIEEFGEPAKTEYDLETAGITGQDNPRSYTWDRPMGEGNGTDVRELDRH